MKLRPCVRRFAELMEHQLRSNDHKGKSGWRNYHPDSLWVRLQQESAELYAEIKACAPAPAYRRCGAEDMKVCLEAADVANFAMMISDLFDEEGGEDGKG